MVYRNWEIVLFIIILCCYWNFVTIFYDSINFMNDFIFFADISTLSYFRY